MNSVCMATYNGEKYLKEQIESILANLKQEDELLVSDDGSADDTWEILCQYRKKDPRIRLLHGPGTGVIANFESVVRRAGGDILFLADQDDVWEPDKIDRVLACFQKTGCSVVVHDADMMDAEGRKTMPSFFEWRGSGPGAARNIVKNSYIGCCMAFRRKLLGRILPIPKNIEMHDQWIGVWGDLCGGSFFLDEALIHYRRHGDNASAMSRHPLGKMVRNRAVFLWELGKRMKAR